MSLITGNEWENAVGAMLRKRAPQWSPRKRQPPGNHKGKGVRFSGAGPADFELTRDGVRIAIEVKAHTDMANLRWPLARLKPSQAEDLSDADHGLVLLRFAGHAPQGSGLLSASMADLVYLLDWRLLQHVWREAHEGQGHGLSEGDCRRIAIVGFGADGVRLVQDEHGRWNCPNIIPALMEAWGLEDE